ncbi:putative dimethyl sulfoxide reductase chain YnfE precursor [compost metagenome]
MQVKESPKGSPELAKTYPLMAVQRKLARSIHSSHGMNEWILEVQRNQPNIMIHPDDAASRHIRNGEWAIAFNHRGEHRALAVVTRQIKRGVVCLDNGWWEQQGGSSSHVTNDHAEVLGNGHCCNSTLVDVRAEA